MDTGLTLAEPWLTAPESRRVCRLLEDAGHRVFFVGGCVRNALLGRPVDDLDLATDASPEAVMALAAAAGVKAVPTGLAHGTVTLVLGGRGFQVTTFRRDVATFGRHAEVAFSTDIAEDAARRDFTMNALYARPDGRVLEPIAGSLADLRARRVRFVGAPAERIAEDYLRILRLFRFHAWYGDPDRGPDPAGLAAAAALQDGLDRLSRERVGAEMTRLLEAPEPAPAVEAMAGAGILARVLPGATPGLVAPLVRAEAAAGLAAAWPRRLAALAPAADATRWGEALRLAKAERRRLSAIAAACREAEPAAAAAFRHGGEAAIDAGLLAAAAAGRAPAAGLVAEAERGADAVFPLRARDLAPLAGRELGRELERLREAWLAADLRPDAAALRAEAPPPG